MCREISLTFLGEGGEEEVEELDEAEEDLVMWSVCGAGMIAFVVASSLRILSVKEIFQEFFIFSCLKLPKKPNYAGLR